MSGVTVSLLRGQRLLPCVCNTCLGVDVRRKGRSGRKSPRTAGWAHVHWGHHSCTGRPDGIFQTNGFCQWDSTSREACSGPRNLPHLLIPGLLCSSSWWAWKTIQETCYVHTSNVCFHPQVLAGPEATSGTVAPVPSFSLDPPSLKVSPQQPSGASQRSGLSSTSGPHQSPSPSGTTHPPN